MDHPNLRWIRLWKPRLVLFALHDMPFPLRDDFLVGPGWDLRGHTLWPIWCTWTQWQQLCSSSSAGRNDDIACEVEGFWQRDGEILCVKGNEIYWLSAEGEPRKLVLTSPTSFVA
eukprot:Skav235892  [mRNA]  locus=scaffold5594:205443:206773:+ [translate_table: standard]